MTILVGEAPSTGIGALQTAATRPFVVIEQFLDSERSQTPLWLPVMFGLGIALWFIIPTRTGWIALIAFAVAMIALGIAIGRMKRVGAALMWGGGMMLLGISLIWSRAEMLSPVRLTRPIVVDLSAQVERVEHQAAFERFRLTLAPTRGSGLPDRIRVTVRPEDFVEKIVAGDQILLKARLLPPPPPAVPGGFDFERQAWFNGIGATGKALGEVRRTGGAREESESLRHRLATHIARSAGQDADGIAVALVTGDQGYVDAADQKAMRDSGLAHLLSVSGLHITAVVVAAMALSLSLLALSSKLALNFRLPLVAAAISAVAAIGYTLLAGAEVPTIRSCIAALLVLAAMAFGRDALSLRLVAAGALTVLLIWPESLVGPSFQLSFAAITSIVAFHEAPRMKALFVRREEALVAGWLRALAALLATGLVVEVALAPIALFHFHKSGLYGALANMVAIPLTTFVVMPLEALALALDALGAGAPVWALVTAAIGLLQSLAHGVAAMPGAVARLPEVSGVALGLLALGLLWLIIWQGRTRHLGWIPANASAILIFLTPSPDLVVSSDGRNMALSGDDKLVASLRSDPRDFIRETLSDRSGTEQLIAMDNLPGANCSADACLATLQRADRDWRILATRSGHLPRWKEMISACASADIVVSERTLPQACQPRWLKADRPFLRRHGGFALSLSPARIKTVFAPRDDHPWRRKE